MKATYRRFLSFVLVLTMLLSMVAPAVNAVASNYIDKTATPLENDYTDITLTVPGDSADMSSDIVFIIGNGPADNYNYLVEMIHKMLIATDGTPTKIKLGLVGFADTTENETVLPLTEMNDTVPGNKVSDYRIEGRYNDGKVYTETAEAYAARKAAAFEAWETENPALLSDMEYIIAKGLEEVESVYSGINLESALITARDMLAADKEVPAERKHMIVVSTGLTYWFDNDAGEPVTVIGTNKFGTYMHGNKYWLQARDASTNTSAGYYMKGWMVVNGEDGNPDYQASWKRYWSMIEGWVAADKDAYVFNPGRTYTEFMNAGNATEIRPQNNANYRYGTAIQNPDDIARVTGAVPYFAGGANPAVDANAAHALNYERAQYEAWVVYKQMETAIGDSFTTVLGEEVEGLGFNCYSIANGVSANPGEEDRWLNSNQIGYNFMHMLGGENTVNYRDADTSFFKSIENKILYTCYADSYVEDFMGYNVPDQGNFEFIQDASTITMVRGDVTYTTTKIETKEGATASYKFSAEGEKDFFLDYYYGNGKDTERFIWTFGDYVSLEKRASLTYKLLLTEKSEIPGVYTVETNLSAVLYPKDSNGNDGEPEEFRKPSVKYEVAKKHTNLVGDKFSENIGNHKYQVSVTIPGGEGVKTHDEFILMVDGSYSGDSEWPAMKKAINSIGQAVLDGSGNTQLTLMAFGMGDNMVLEHIKDADELAKALGELPGNLLRGVSSTNCEAGFTGVAEYIENHDETLREAVVVYITDGGINTDETPRAFYDWQSYVHKNNVNSAIYYAVNGVPYESINGVTKDDSVAFTNEVWKAVFEYSNMDIGSEYPISEMERAFLQYDEDHKTDARYSFLMAMKNSAFDKYPNVWNRTYNSVFDLAKVEKVRDLYLVRYKNDSRASWMPEAANRYESDTIHYVKSDSISTLTEALGGAISDFAKYPYNDVVVTDYMSKWVILDPETVKVVDVNGNVVAKFDPENSPKDADGNYTSYVYKWVGEALCANKAPLIVDVIPESGYAAGGPDVVGNANGPIHRITWNIKDGPLMRTDVYTLQYEVFVNTEEPGFEYDKDYPSNGDTYAEYTDDEGEEHKTVIDVPDVEADEILTSVSGTKTWKDASDKDGVRPESITVKLLANGKVVDTVTVTEADGWKFAFENLPKYANGVEIVYSIMEDAVDGYTTTYDGFNVTNTHVANAELVLGGIKYLDFEVAEGFEFVLVDKDGSVIESVTSKEDGKFEFSALVFDEEGTYTFVIRETVGNNEDIIYDESVYTVTVTVTKDAEELKASYTVVKGEEAYEGDIEFNNETIVEIPDEDPPYDDNPDTGDNTVIYMLVIAGTFVVFNVLLKSRRRKVD